MHDNNLAIILFRLHYLITILNLTLLCISGAKKTHYPRWALLWKAGMLSTLKGMPCFASGLHGDRVSSFRNVKKFLVQMQTESSQHREGAPDAAMAPPHLLA